MILFDIFKKILLKLIKEILEKILTYINKADLKSLFIFV